MLRVSGEVDLCTVPVLHAALDESLDRRPAYLVVDLARMTFCSVRGLDLLTQTGRIAAAKATGYAVTGVLPQIDRIWTLCWGGDLPMRRKSWPAGRSPVVRWSQAAAG
ncbi:MAG: STAS domain-containing protein [Pseudonocardia sp.]|nr:STAS domain-containing protein [Pseudonocardia sp.]